MEDISKTKDREPSAAPQPEAHVATQKTEQAQLATDLSRLEARVNAVHDQVITLNARVQANVDFTDDFVASANNLVTYTESRIDQTLSHTDNVLSNADTFTGIVLWTLAFIMTIGSLGITLYLGKRREEHLREAISSITTKLKNDEDFRDEFIKALISHDALRDNINYAINQAAKNFHSEKDRPEKASQDKNQRRNPGEWKKLIELLKETNKEGEK